MYFDVLTADPPWSFKTYSEKGKDRSPERHYPCMELDDVKNLGPYIRRVAAQPSVLLLWTVSWLLPECIAVGEAWGFEYKTRAFVWTKEKTSGAEHMGNGYYTRSNPEDCYLFVRTHNDRPHGRKLPRRSCSVREWLHAPVGRHSEKPEAFFHRVEELFGPRTRRLELFGRTPRPGWTVLGNDLDGRDIRESLNALYLEQSGCSAHLPEAVRSTPAFPEALVPGRDPLALPEWVRTLTPERWEAVTSRSRRPRVAHC